MPFAQFSEARILSGSTLLAVTGTYDPGQLTAGVVEHPHAQFHYAIMQGPVLVRGHALEGGPGDWTGTSPAPELREGAAIAAGVGVVFRELPSPAFETFTWSQEILVRKE